MSLVQKNGRGFLKHLKKKGLIDVKSIVGKNGSIFWTPT